jgi:putative phage-type endonuclease
MKIIQCVQGSEEWFNARLGKLTSSTIADVVAKRKRGTEELACRVDLRLDLVTERLTRKPCDHFVSLWMEQGKDREPLARIAYELRFGFETEQIGFAEHERIAQAGASPDGLVGDDGLVEFKCPKTNTHLGYRLAECVPEQYVPQMMWQMAVTGRQWCDFVSFHPDFPDPLDLFVCRLIRDDSMIAAMEAEAKKFLDEVEVVMIQVSGGLEGLLERSLPPRAVIPAY